VKVGHGNLAHRALKPMIPFEDPTFPYTVRLFPIFWNQTKVLQWQQFVPETLALLDCGVKIKNRFQNCMGLITDETTGKYAIFSTIFG
jgi:polyribonucleotide nucleotidyltransferase